jgi:hypothetical protein
MPTVEEVREWRKAEDSIIASGIIPYWTMEGLAQQAAFCEAEKLPRDNQGETRIASFNDVPQRKSFASLGMFPGFS